MRSIIGLLALLAAPAFATGFPPIVTKSFTPPIVAVNQVSTLTITFTNPNSFPMSGASISDTFPAGLMNAGPVPGTGFSTCGAAFIALIPTGLLMNNGTIPANGSCTITAPVLSASTGVYQNDTGSLFTGAGTSLGGGTAFLTVVTQIPAFSRAVLFLLGAILAAAGSSRLT